MELTPDLVTELWQQKGWVGGAIVAIYYAVRVCKWPWLQKLLPAKWRWENLPDLLKKSLVGAASAAGATGLVMAGKMDIATAAAAVLPIALGAVTVHKTTQAAGDALDTTALKNDPDYAPGLARKALSIVVPVSDIMKTKHEQ